MFKSNIKNKVKKMGIYEIYGTIFALCIGCISFFVKRAFTQLDKKSDKCELDKCRREMSELKHSLATKEEVASMKERMDKFEQKLDFLMENAVRKVDFVRYFGEVNKKLDDLLRR
jgi:hypothetical protein